MKKIHFPDLIAGDQGVYVQSKIRHQRNGILRADGTPLKEGDRPFPPLDEVVSWVERLTAKQREILSNPQLIDKLIGVVEPVVCYMRRAVALQALDISCPQVVNFYIRPPVDEQRKLEQPISGWTLGLGDGGSSPNRMVCSPEGTLRQALEAYLECYGGEDGVRGMDLLTYFACVEHGLIRGVSIDSWYGELLCTLLDGSYKRENKRVWTGIIHHPDSPSSQSYGPLEVIIGSPELDRRGIPGLRVRPWVVVDGHNRASK